MNFITASVGAATTNPATSDFFNTGIGSVVAAFLTILGFLVVVVAIVRVVKDISAGKVGAAFKTIVGSLVLASFMLFPGQLIYPAINAFSGIVHSVIDTVSSTASTTTTQPGG